MTANDPLPTASSPGRKNRPSAGCTRKTLKKSAVTSALVRRIGSPAPLRLTPIPGMYAATDSSVREWSRTPTNSARECPPSHTLTNDGVSGYGSGRRSTVVDDAEDRGVRPNAERQRDDRDDGEGRCAEQHAECVPQVAAKIVQRPHAAGIAPLLAYPFHRAEGQSRLATRPLGRSAAPLALSRFLVEVKGDLLVHFAIEAAAQQERAQHDAAVAAG